MPTTAQVKLRIREGTSFKRLITARSGGQSFSVRVGFVGDRGAATHEDSGLTNAHLAALLEYGNPENNQPARPALAPAWDLNQRKYRDMCRKVAEGVSRGTVDLEQGLGLIGEAMVADLRDYIVSGSGIAPENAPSVKARKEAKPSGSPWGVRTWVDSGALVGSITWVVVKGDGTP